MVLCFDLNNEPEQSQNISSFKLLDLLKDNLLFEEFLNWWGNIPKWDFSTTSQEYTEYTVEIKNVEKAIEKTKEMNSK